MRETNKTRRAGNFGELQRNGRESGETHFAAGSRVDDISNTPTETGKAALVLAHAREWIRANPDLWARLEADAMRAVENEQRISIQQFIEGVRAKDRVNRIGEPVKINNSYASVFARILVADHPEVRPFIELRRSPCFDQYFDLQHDRLGGKNG